MEAGELVLGLASMNKREGEIHPLSIVLNLGTN